MRFTIDSIWRDKNHPDFNEKKPLTVRFSTVQDTPENIYIFGVTTKALRNFKAFREAVIDAFAIWLDEPEVFYQYWERTIAAGFERGRLERAEAFAAGRLDSPTDTTKHRPPKLNDDVTSEIYAAIDPSNSFARAAFNDLLEAYARKGTE